MNATVTAIDNSQNNNIVIENNAQTDDATQEECSSVSLENENEDLVATSEEEILSADTSGYAYIWNHESEGRASAASYNTPTTSDQTYDNYVTGQTVSIDLWMRSLSGTWYLNVNGVDKTSKYDSNSYAWEDNFFEYKFDNAGTYTIYAYYKGSSSNYVSNKLIYNVKEATKETTTTLNIDKTTIFPGDSLKITPTTVVKGTENLVTSGQYEIYVNNVNVKTIDVGNSCDYTNNIENTYYVYAKYIASTGYENSTSQTKTFIINSDTSVLATTTSVSFDKTIILPGGSITITPTVTTPNGDVSGTVDLYDGNDELIEANVVIGNPFTYNVGTTSGNYQIYARYLGNEELKYAPSNSTKSNYKVKGPLDIKLTVDGETDFKAIGAYSSYSSNIINYIFYADCNGYAPLLKVYDVYKGETNIVYDGDVRGDSQQISMWFSYQNERGPHVVYVEFEGDDEYLASRSNNVTFNVYEQKSYSDMSSYCELKFNPNPVMEGDYITVTPKIQYYSSGYKDATGTVTFYDDSDRTVELGSVNVGEAFSYRIPFSDEENSYRYYLYATYNGGYDDVNYMAFGSGNLQGYFTVDIPLKTTLTLENTTETTINYGNTVTIKANIVDSENNNVADGNISWYVDNEWIADLSVSDLFTIPNNLSLGTHTVSAKYIGGNGYKESNSQNNINILIEENSVKILKIEINNVEYSNNVTAIVTASQVGTYTITIGGKQFNVEINDEDNGVKTVILDKFSVKDNYEAIINSIEDSSLSNNTYFNVTKATLTFTVTTIGNNTVMNVGEKSISVNIDAYNATGKVQYYEDDSLLGEGESIDISNLADGTHIITIKYVDDVNYNAEDEIINFIVNLPEMETNVYLEFNTTEVRVNGKILVTAHVLDKNGNEIKTGDVKVYTRPDFNNADPIKTVVVGESFELTVDSNSFSTYSNPYKLYSRYMGKTTNDIVYKESSNTTGTIYYHVSANNIELTASDLTIYVGQSIDITANVNGVGVIALSVNGEDNGTLTKGTPRKFTLTESGDYEFIANYTMTTSDYCASCVSEKLTVHVLDVNEPVVTIEFDKNTTSKDGKITVTPTVTGSSDAKGTVEFYDENDVLLGSIDLNKENTFEYSVTGEAGTIHSIYAKYTDANSAFPSANSAKKDYKIKGILTIELARTGEGLVKVNDEVYFTVTYSDSISDNLELWLNDDKLWDISGSTYPDIKFEESDIGVNNVFIKFLGNDDYEATVSNNVTIKVVKPIETVITLELNTDELTANSNITITPKVVEKESGKEVNVGRISIYDDHSNYLPTINAGESVELSATTQSSYNNPYYLNANYYGETTDDAIYVSSQTTSGIKYYFINSNSLKLTVNGENEVTIKDGMEFNIKADLYAGNGVITLYVNGKENSTISKEASFTFPVGDYTIKAVYTKGNDYYASCESNEVIVHVLEKQINTIVVSVDEVTLPDSALICVSATIDGEYTIDVNGSDVKVQVTSGKGNNTIQLPAGSYYANVTGQDDDAIITNAVFTVSPEPVIGNLIIRDNNYPENATIVLSGEGNVTINIEYFVEKIMDSTLDNEIIFNIGGTTKYVYNPTYGQYIIALSHTINETSVFTVNATYHVWGLTEGIYNIQSNVLTYSVVVTAPAKKDVILNVEVDEEQEEDNYFEGDWTDSYDIVTKASQDIKGVIVYKEGDIELGQSNIGEIFNINASSLGLGKHEITAVFEGDDLYNEANVTFTIDIDKKVIWYTLNIDNVTYPDHAIGKFYSDVDGNYIITINGTEYNVNFEWFEVNGAISFDINQLPAGTYFVSSIIYEDMEHFEFGVSEREGQNKLPTFTVNSKENVLNDNVLSSVNGTTPEFSINLPGATGNLTVKVGNKTYFKQLSDGKATVEVTDLPAGNYVASVIYSGDANHNQSTVHVSFTVSEKIQPVSENTLNINVPEASTVPTFSIDLPGATGNFTVIIDGKKYTKQLVNGKATITIDDLVPGDHEVIVSYSGDNNHPPVSKTTKISIPKPVLSKNKNINMLYSSGASYKVRVTINGKAVVGEKVTFKFNGKTYTRKTDKNGYATLKLPNVKPKKGKYNIQVSFKGVKKTNKVKVNSIIKAKNIKVKKSKKVTKIIVSLKKVNKKFLKKKTVKIKFRGKTFKAKTNKKGVATFKIKKNVFKKLKVGKKYTYKVTYGKDIVSKKITIRR